MLLQRISELRIEEKTKELEVLQQQKKGADELILVGKLVKGVQDQNGLKYRLCKKLLNHIEDSVSFVTDEPKWNYKEKIATLAKDAFSGLGDLAAKTVHQLGCSYPESRSAESVAGPLARRVGGVGDQPYGRRQCQWWCSCDCKYKQCCVCCTSSCSLHDPRGSRRTRRGKGCLSFECNHKWFCKSSSWRHPGAVAEFEWYLLGLGVYASDSSSAASCSVYIPWTDSGGCVSAATEQPKQGHSTVRITICADSHIPAAAAASSSISQLLYERCYA